MNLTAYQDKIASRFSRLDRDRDGVVTESDFQEMAQHILDEFGHSPDSPKGKALVSGAQRLWTSFAKLADADHDGEITEEEFVEAASAHLRNDREAFTRMVQPWASAVIEVADADNDGHVTVAEWERMLRAMRATPERAQAKAASLDTDGDGRISLDEVLDSAVRLYVTDEPNLV